MRAVVLMLVAMVAIARAQPITSDATSSSAEVSQALAQIAKLEAQLDYEQALTLANQTIARGISSHDQLADLNLIAGRLAAGLEHPDEAQAHFARVLALRPNTQLIAGTSPKLLAPFAAARATNPTFGVSFLLEGGQAKLLVEHDSLHMVSGLRLTFQGSKSAVLGDLVISVGKSEVGMLEAIDEHGNELSVVRYPNQEGRRAGTYRHTPLLVDWKTYAVVTGVALAVAGVSAWRFRSAQDEWNQLNGEGGHDYSQLHAIETRGQHWAIAADVSFGVTALAAIATGILFADRDHVGFTSHVAVTSDGAAFIARF